MIGLGRMGGNMTRRLAERGHDVKTYDPGIDSTASTLEELRDQLDAPRAFWMMIPAGEITENTFQTLLGLAGAGDTIVDGGNSNFKDSKRRHAWLQERGLKFVDAGISGGIWGLVNGYGTMVGGDPEAVEPLEPIFTSLAPPEGGYVYCGLSGAGHYTKMVHNGIEYGLMQAYAEGFEIMHASEYPLDLEKIAKAWMHGTVIRSWLLDLAGRAFEQNGTDLADIKGWVADSGEGRWTVAEAIDQDVPAPIITLSLLARFSSRQDESYSAKVLAALRNQFGGHAVKSE
jgi:6-phosphogluconate dehydrogenase